jgi:multiple sugar transport system ATP-binding protein
MARLTFEAVGKRYGTVTALAALDLDVGDGEALCLLGPSGAGKSTALRLAAGLEPVSSGRVLIDRLDVTRRPAAQRDLAMVFQSYALFPHLDVAENIGFGLAVRKVPKGEIRRLVGDVADLVGCGHLLHRRPAQLSGGERQRVAVARALVRRPAILLLDEPLSNLDPSLRADMRAELRRLHDSVGSTMVHVTHDQFEALAIGDRVAIVRDGELEQAASPDDIYRRPANRFVATFVGQPRMNVLDATRTGAELAVGPFRLPARLAPDGPVDAGIRPEHLQLGDPDGVPADVELVERAGDVTIAHLRVGAHRLVGRFGSDTGIRSGDRIVVGAPARRWYLFDRDTGCTVRFAA